MTPSTVYVLTLLFSLSELFGPILPIVEVEDVHEAIQVVADRSVFRSTREDTSRADQPL